MSKLTRKQQMFVGKLLADKKMSATEAAAQTYKVKKRHTAEVIASENLRKPEIMAILADHDAAAQTTLSEGLEASRNVYRFNGESKSYELIGVEADHQSRLRAADSILDRLHGRATQRVEQQTVSLHFGMDLGSVVEDN